MGIQNQLVMHTAILNDACVMEAKVGTTGFRGGDGGHGGRTVIEIRDRTCGGDVKFEILDGGHAIRFSLKGDAELRTIVGALEFAAQKLKELSDPLGGNGEFPTAEEWQQSAEKSRILK